MKKNGGFTLVEILASVVILGLLLTVFCQFFIFSQKTTSDNEDKLVALNLAQTVFERIKDGEYPEITNIDKEAEVDYPKLYDNETVCKLEGEYIKECSDRYILTSNDKKYMIRILVEEKLEVGLLSVEVQVFDKEGNDVKSKVKGFVEI
ncbi:type IV pilus modification PilV family protein [Bacillus massilinigeriensis]|uniref:type IV pilus modification PilV family protein n=1 Tax=Bacillus massilionigeriensis TaxID=1805475 RepID=UPI00096B1B5C|nr:type II secretion system protein [Bacillus massilionigeriensis]